MNEFKLFNNSKETFRKLSKETIAILKPLLIKAVVIILVCSFQLFAHVELVRPCTYILLMRVVRFSVRCSRWQLRQLVDRAGLGGDLLVYIP